MYFEPKYLKGRPSASKGFLYSITGVQVHSSWHEEHEQWHGKPVKTRPHANVFKYDKPCFVLLFHNPKTQDWVVREKRRAINAAHYARKVRKKNCS